MEQIYKKIIIKSESDLPKEDGDYIICSNKDNPYHYTRVRSFTNDQSELFWINNVDWYLLPVELPSEEEIETTSKEFHKVHGGYHPDFKKGAKWLIEYLKQK
jgi:hypothetical protein